MMMPSRMGTVHAKVTIVSTDRVQREVIELVVDTGSLFTWIPEEVLSRLRVPRSRTHRFRTIDGSLVERPVADCLIECEGEESYTPVVHGREGDASVLGVAALEVLGLEVDPQNRRLKRVDAFLAYAVG